ncbi:hypothetical protein AURDEDRAFT_161732 [Auricularia subglabra TFB-10046 SS5]|nr:hypothetical protein AURDEDRAFT_161732 [Auricularia subglabra TFB-10046 SS5]
MLTTSHHEAGPDLPADLALSLETVLSTLALKTAVCVERSDNLNARFDAMQSVFTRTIRNISSNWNRTHDMLNVLPVELRAMCWSFLPQADLVGLASVCSSWRDLSRSMPSLWTKLAICGNLTGLDTVFARSAQLSFEVSVSVCSVKELAYVDDCLRIHAHRLRVLCISDTDIHFRGRRWDEGLFRYPVPALEHLTLDLRHQYNDGHFLIAPDVFKGHAPNLRSLTLHEVPIPASCLALSRLTALVMDWSLDVAEGGIQHIFTLLPDLEQFELLNVWNTVDLPQVPASFKLRRMKLAPHGIYFPRLHASGYLTIPFLEVTVRETMTMHYALELQSPSLHRTLSVGCADVRRTQVILRSDHGPTASLIVDDANWRAPCTMLRSASCLAFLERLVLPSTAPFATRDTARYPYIEGDLQLPVLRTFAIAHRPRGVSSLFARAAVHGNIVAPMLSRVELVRVGDAGEDWGRADAIKPGLLALFIGTHIQCSSIAALEVVIGPENAGLLDLGDETGMERLRRCVGKLTIW